MSVVFVDLVGSTARAEASDPEDVRALLRVYHERARDELERYGGTVEKFIGDAVVAVFGAPVSHEDDPERAVRGALAVRAAVARLNDEESGRDLHVRIAVNTGEALVALTASPREGEAMVAGDVMNTAARLQGAAPIDGILVGEHTYRATDREIVYREAEPVLAKGKSEPIPVWEAVEAVSRFGVDLGGAGRAELVGREAELDVLVSSLTRARQERSTQLVTLVGVPGIGKSRLVYELSRVVDADEELITWRQGRSLPYGEGVSYWALGEIVKAQAGILESDTADTAEQKLTVATNLVADDGERSWVERHLRPLVGLGGDKLATDDSRGEAFAAWRRYLEAIAEDGPTVLVFEDLHWADDGLLDFVDGLVDWVDGVALLVVCTARPELLDRRREWGGGKRNATTVSLTPLDDDATGRLVLALLDRPVIGASVQQAVVERAAGNPLYAEEFVRMLDARGSVDGRLPETVQGIVAARIDLLPSSEKSVLQSAAVLGKVFWSDALVALTGSESWQLAETLRSLERKEFIRREHRSAVSGATQHAFVHTLVRDAAYGQLPRAARALHHLATATWIESLPEDRAEDRAETLAHHYLTAIELRRAAGEDVTDVAARAVGPLQEAGERALALSAFEPAAHFLASALELLPSDTEPSAELLFSAGQAFEYVGRQGDELARAVDAFEAAGDHERAAECAVAASMHAWFRDTQVGWTWLDRAAALVEGRPASRAQALVAAAQARRLMLNFQRETALPLAERAVELALEVGADEIRADALVTLGSGRVANGDARGVELLQEAIVVSGDQGQAASRARVNLGWAWEILGDVRRAATANEEALSWTLRTGFVARARFIRTNVAATRYALGDWDRSAELIDAELGAGDRHNLTWVAWNGRARLLAARGDGSAALSAIHRAVELARSSGDPQSIWPALISLARVAGRLNLEDESRAALGEVVAALAASETVGDVSPDHIELICELDARGRAEDARELLGRMPPGRWTDVCAAVLCHDFVTAADMLDAIGEQPLQAELRLDAGRAFAAEGRLAEAEEQLERARVFWRSVGASAYLREADKLIAAAS